MHVFLVNETPKGCKRKSESLIFFRKVNLFCNSVIHVFLLEKESNASQNLVEEFRLQAELDRKGVS